MAKIVLKSKLQNLAMKKTEAYVTRSVRYTKIDKNSLLSYAAMNSGVDKGTIYAAANAIAKEFQNFIFNGHSVEVPEIGTFRFGVKAHATDTQAEAGASQVYRRKILFVPCPSLKQKMNLISLVDATEAPEEEGEGGEGGGD